LKFKKESESAKKFNVIITWQDHIPKKLTYQNYLSQGIIYTVYYGDLTTSSINQTGKEILNLIKQIQTAGKPVLILSDITKIGKINLGAKKTGVGLIKNLDYQKLAIVGVNFITEQLVKAVVTAPGVGFKVRLFDNQKDARKWLKS